MSLVVNKTSKQNVKRKSAQNVVMIIWQEAAYFVITLPENEELVLGFNHLKNVLINIL